MSRARDTGDNGHVESMPLDGGTFTGGIVLGGSLDVNGFNIITANGGYVDDINLSPGDSSNFGQQGGSINLTGGNGLHNYAGSGGHISIIGGETAYAGGDSGYVSIEGGRGTTYPDTNGGDVTLKAGRSIAITRSGGNVNIDGGGGFKLANPGDVIITGGYCIEANTNPAGEITLTGGSSGTNSAPGDVILTGGSMSTYNPNQGGNVQLVGANGAGGSPLHDSGGGDIVLDGGWGGTSHGDGGNIIITPGKIQNYGSSGRVQIMGSDVGEGGQINLFEGSAFGTAFIGLKTPYNMVGNSRTWTLPEDNQVTAAGKFMTTDTFGNLSFAEGTLTGLSDVSLGSPVLDEVLTFNGANWINQAVAGGGGGTSVVTAGSYKTLNANRNATNTVLITAVDLVLTNTDDEPVIINSVSVTIDAGTTLVDGLDTGSRATSTWYYMHVIWNGSTTSSLMSLSDTAPTLPSGYTHFARVGMLRTDGTTDLKNFEQINNYCFWRENTPIHTSGSALSWSARTVTSFYPPIAKTITATFQLSRECGLSSESTGRGGSYHCFGTSGGNTTFGLFTNSNKIATMWCGYADTIYYWQQGTGDDLDAVAWWY